MENQYFKFKQFTIQQQNAAMKVGTDGVLLGAWTEIPKYGNILDIGTGTGLISLMLSQRNSNLIITALEIDVATANEAAYNIRNSPWSKQINVINNSLQKFTNKVTVQYNLIVSNPPFFNNSKPSLNKLRNMARQTSELSISELFDCTKRLLSPKGVFSIILPYNSLNETCEIASRHNLFAKKITLIKPNPQKEPHRFMALFTHNKSKIIIDKLIIESNRRHQYSKKYKKLTKEFYLDEKEKQQFLNKIK